MTDFRIETFDELFDAVLSLKNKEQARKFFEDLCTIKEIQDMAQRLEVASLLQQGKNYQEISKETGVSTATICRVNKCLNYGSGGYELVLKNVKGKNKNG